jgi:hypothetical protein
MKKTCVLLTLFLTFCFTSQAQTDDFSKTIVNYLKINGTPQQYELAYDNMFEVLKKQFKNAEVPEKVWVKLHDEGKDKSINDILNFLTFAYRNHFTKAEIETLTEFYKTPAAKQMLKDVAGLTQEQNEEIAAFFQGEVGKKTLQVKDALAKDISEISSQWSRDLFMDKMSKLVKMGYNNQ